MKMRVAIKSSATSAPVTGDLMEGVAARAGHERLRVVRADKRARAVWRRQTVTRAERIVR